MPIRASPFRGPYGDIKLKISRTSISGRNTLRIDENIAGEDVTDEHFDVDTENRSIGLDDSSYLSDSGLEIDDNPDEDDNLILNASKSLKILYGTKRLNKASLFPSRAHSSLEDV